jgi:hypothetical protein
LEPKPEISGAGASILAAVREPLRLAVLLAIERRPSSASEITQDLADRYDTKVLGKEPKYGRVKWAFDQLERDGLIVELARHQRDAPSPARRGDDLMRVFETRHTGWKALARALDTIAANVRPDTNSR